MESVADQFKFYDGTPNEAYLITLKNANRGNSQTCKDGKEIREVGQVEYFGSKRDKVKHGISGIWDKGHGDCIYLATAKGYRLFTNVVDMYKYAKSTKGKVIITRWIG